MDDYREKLVKAINDSPNSAVAELLLRKLGNLDPNQKDQIMAEKPKKPAPKPKPGTTQRSGGGGNTNPTQPPKKPGG